jgi:hypothetical protein
MVKRVVWFGLGAASGCVAAVWGLSSVRRASQRLTPERMSSELTDALRERGRSLSDDLRDAVAEGREAMQARELELRASIRPGPTSSRTRSDAGPTTSVRYPG